MFTFSHKFYKLSILTVLVLTLFYRPLHCVRLEKLPRTAYFAEFKNLIAEELKTLPTEFIYENRRIADRIAPLLDILLQREDPHGRALASYKVIPGEIVIRLPMPDRHTVNRFRELVVDMLKGDLTQRSLSKKRPNFYKHIELDGEGHWIIPELSPYRIEKDVSYHQKLTDGKNKTSSSKLLYLWSRGRMDPGGCKLQERFIKRLVSSTLFKTVNSIQEPFTSFLTQTYAHASFTLFASTSNSVAVMPLGNLVAFSPFLNFNGDLASNRRIYSLTDGFSANLPNRMTPLCITEAKVSEIAEAKRPEEERRKEKKQAKKKSTMSRFYNATCSMLGLRRVETRSQIRRRNLKIARRWLKGSTKELRRHSEALQIVANDYVNFFINQTNKDSLFLNLLNVWRTMQGRQSRGQLVCRISCDPDVRMRFAQLNHAQFIEHTKNILSLINMDPTKPQGFAHSFLKISIKTSLHKAYNLAKRYKGLINSVYCDANKFRCLNRKFCYILTYDKDISADLPLTPVEQGLISVGLTHKDFLQHHRLRLPGSKQKLISIKPKITNNQYEELAESTLQVLEQCWEKSITDSLKNTLNLFKIDDYGKIRGRATFKENNTTSGQSSERRESHEEGELKAKMSNFYKVALNWAFSLDTLELKYFKPDLGDQRSNNERVGNREANRGGRSRSRSNSSSSSSSSDDLRRL